MSANPPGPPSETGRPNFRVKPLTSPGGPVEMPSVFDPQRLLKRTLQIVLVLGVFGLVILLAPGLGSVRDLLTGADPAWIVLAIVLEALSGVRADVPADLLPAHALAHELGDLVVGARDGVDRARERRRGLALGAWILHEGGMPGEQIARRSVAFFLIKSSVNFVAVVVVGTVMALGLAGPDLSIWLTAVPAVGRRA